MGETAKMKAALVLLIQILGLAPVVSALKNQAKRRFFDSFVPGSFFNSVAETTEDTDDEMAVIIGCTIGAVIVLCICGCIFFCFCKKKMCFNNRSDSYPEPTGVQHN